MALVIRQAIPKDAPKIAKIHVETWQCAYKNQIPDSYLNNLSIEERTKGWKKQIENPEKGVYAFVIETDGKVVGWCTAGVSRDKDASKETGELHGIYIHPDHTSKGFGSKLMSHALTTLKKDGYEKATLWVLDTNEKTRKWYEHKGWRVEGKTKSEPREGFDLHETRYIIDL